MHKTAELSSRERYLATFEHQTPDRVPIFLDIHPPRFFTDQIRFYTQFERAQVLLAQNCDPMINLWLPTPEPHPDVTVRTWREERDGRTYIGKEFDTPKGVLRQVVEETPDWCDHNHGFWTQRTLGGTMREEYSMHVFDDHNISRRTEPWVKGPEDLEKLPYILQPPRDWEREEWRHDAERAMEFARNHDLLTMVRRTIVHDASQWFCDIPWFMMQLYDNPGFVEQFLDIFEDAARWQMELVLPLQPDVIQHRGWYDGPDFWGGHHFDTYVAPLINRFADAAHDADVRHCYLLTEGWGPYLDKFANLNTDIYWGADPSLGRASLAAMKTALGREKTILGGVSTEQHLINGTPDTVRAATRAAIQALAPGGGFVLGSSSSVWLPAKWENVAAMIDEALNAGAYPIA